MNARESNLHFDANTEDGIMAFDKRSLFKPLPIEKYKKHLLYSLSMNDVVVVVGETGSGKTTKIPLFLREYGFTAGGQQIAVTLPKRISVINVAQRLATSLECELGKEVGFSISLESNYCEDTQIKVLTDGMLVREMYLDPLLSKYSVIMVDDCHERSMYSDLLLGLLKKVFQQRKTLKLITSSATLDASTYKDFFTSSEMRTQILEIEGRMFPVELLYLKEPCRDYVKKALETTCLIHKKYPRSGDVLIFLTGFEEIDQFIKLFIQCVHSKILDNNIYALPLYAGLPLAKQMEAFQPSSATKRKVIVATNVAETSITIDGIMFVIDCCFVKAKYYDSAMDMESLIKSPCSASSCSQRAGRAGRICPGFCYRLCTKGHFDQLEVNSPPEIQRIDSSLLLLQMKALGIKNILDFHFLTPPPEENVVKSLELLYALGALDEYTELTKEIGKQLVEFPLDPRLGAVLLHSNEDKFTCTEEILSLVSLLSAQNIFLSHRDPSYIPKALKKDVGVVEGDHLTLLNAFNTYNKIKGDKNKEQFCREHQISSKSLERAIQIRAQLRSIFRQLKISIKPSDDDDDSEGILKCVTSGYFTHVAQLNPDGSYRNILNLEDSLYIHPTSVLTNLRPKWIVYHELIVTSYKYMRIVSEIHPEWLFELAPHYFTNKRTEELEAKHFKEATTERPANSSQVYIPSQKRKLRSRFQQFSTMKKN